MSNPKEVRVRREELYHWFHKLTGQGLGWDLPKFVTLIGELEEEPYHIPGVEQRLKKYHDPTKEEPAPQAPKWTSEQCTDGAHSLCHYCSCPCHNKPQEPEVYHCIFPPNYNCDFSCHEKPQETLGKFEKAFASLDFEGMARAWHEGDITWHAKEWENFIRRVREEALAEGRLQHYICCSATCSGECACHRVAASKGSCCEQCVCKWTDAMKGGIGCLNPTCPCHSNKPKLPEFMDKLSSAQGSNTTMMYKKIQEIVAYLAARDK